MSLRQRDIVLIPVPFTDLTSQKTRPVLVLSSTENNARSPDILVAAITSNITSGTVGIVIDAPDMEAGTLPRLSLVRPDKLYTLSQSIVARYFGRLTQSRFDQVLEYLDAVLGR